MLKLFRSLAFSWRKRHDLRSNQSSFEIISTPPRKSLNGNAEEALHITERILEIYESLERKEKNQSLKPSAEVNSFFSELVGICIQTRKEEVERLILGDARIESILLDLRRMCGTGEALLEREWAERVLLGDEDEVYQNLQQFPYFQNYIDLTRMELAAIRAIDPNPIRKIAFIGSGPLPLTSLCLLDALQKEEIQILNIDCDFFALSQSRNMCERLGRRGEGMQFLQHEVGTNSDPDLDLREFDVVYLAALVGNTIEAKERILMDVMGRMREGALAVVRSARGLRELMYPVFEVAGVDRGVGKGGRRGLEVGLVVHPYGEVFNSVVVGRVRGNEKGEGETEKGN